jgi:hypothetical protein
MQVAQERDLSSLERTLKYPWAVETYVRFALRTFWFFYWPMLVFAAVVVVAAPSLFMAQRGPGGPGSDDLHTYYLVATSPLIGLAFWLILIKAVAHYSKKWAIVGLLIGCYLTYDNLGIVRNAVAMYPKLPNAGLHLLFALALRLALQVCLLVAFWHIARMKQDDSALCLPVQNLRFFPRRALRDSKRLIRCPARTRAIAVVLVGKLAEILSATRPDRKVTAMFIDMAFGSPIYERLRYLGFNNVFEVNSGLTHTPDRTKANMRAFMWSQMKDWLLEGAIETDEKMAADLAGPGYHINRSNLLVLESKAARPHPTMGTRWR